MPFGGITHHRAAARTSARASSQDESSRGKQWTKIGYEWRQRIIYRVMNEGHSIAAIAQEDQLARCAIWGIIRRFEGRGLTSRLLTGGNRLPAKLDPDGTACLLEYIEKHPDATFADVQQHLGRRGMHGSISSIDRALRGRHYVLKRLYIQPDRCNSPQYMEKRRRWCTDSTGISYSDAVYLVEAGFNLHLSRRRGRAVKTLPLSGSRNLTVIAAVSGCKGMLPRQFHIGGTNGDTFAEYLENTLLSCLQHRTRTIIVDDISFQYSKRWREAIERSGHKVMSIPAYNPQLNLAERILGSIKTQLTRQETRTHGQLDRLLEDQINSITKEQCNAWLKEAQAWHEAALNREPISLLYDALHAVTESQMSSKLSEAPPAPFDNASGGELNSDREPEQDAVAEMASPVRPLEPRPLLPTRSGQPRQRIRYFNEQDRD